MYAFPSFGTYITLQRVLQVTRKSKTDYVTSVYVCVIHVNCMHTTHTL